MAGTEKFRILEDERNFREDGLEILEVGRSFREDWLGILEVEHIPLEDRPAYD